MFKKVVQIKVTSAFIGPTVPKSKRKKCPTYYHNAGPFCVKRYLDMKPFNSAQKRCLKDKATLLEFGSFKESKAIEKFFRRKFKAGSYYWFGLRKGMTYNITYETSISCNDDKRANNSYAVFSEWQIEMAQRKTSHI